MADSAKANVLTAIGTFNSNSFTNDRFLFGLEYMFNSSFVLRAGFDYYSGLYSSDLFENTDINGGPTGGFSYKRARGVDGDAGRGFEVSYSYRHTSVFSGTHSVGLVFEL